MTHVTRKCTTGRRHGTAAAGMWQYEGKDMTRAPVAPEMTR